MTSGVTGGGTSHERVFEEGPLLTNEGAIAQELLAKMKLEIVQAVSHQALAEVHRLLNERIQHPTPYYETQLMVELVPTDISTTTMVVHDRGIIYGPWLEGVSKKNRPRPGFPGYHAFEETTKTITPRVEALVNSIVAKYVGEMGGI